MSWFFPPKIKKASAWSFDTFGSSGANVGVFAGSLGTVVLKNPQGKSVNFWYGGFGAGLGFGLKLGKLKIKLRASANVGPTAFRSTGKLYILDNLDHDELSKSDIQGPCAFFEVGGGLIGGGSGTAMLVGLDPKFLPMLTNPLLTQVLVNSGKGLLLMAGFNVGMQAGGGGSALLGFLHA